LRSRTVGRKHCRNSENSGRKHCTSRKNKTASRHVFNKRDFKICTQRSSGVNVNYVPSGFSYTQFFVNIFLKEYENNIYTS